MHMNDDGEEVLATHSSSVWHTDDKHGSTFCLFIN